MSIQRTALSYTHAGSELTCFSTKALEAVPRGIIWTKQGDQDSVCWCQTGGQVSVWHDLTICHMHSESVECIEGRVALVKGL